PIARLWLLQSGPDHISPTWSLLPGHLAADLEQLPAGHGLVGLIYIDYDLDVIVSPTYEYEIVDEEEYEMNQQFMNYPQEVKKKIEEELQILLQWIKHQKGPFQPGFVMDWYKKFREGSFSF
ncbi:MAG TPA: DUF402 domain-containing protein, partial [Massilibacterium sp.]|nr:DUF402 domain-containing protein [Massilibacterium sp.]